MPEITAKTWNRYLTPNFLVVSSIMGKSHDFVFDSYNISIKIPSQERASRGHDFDEVAYLTAWSGSKDKPLEYTINKVDVYVEVKDNTSVPEEASNTENIDTSVFSQEECVLLDKTMTKYTDVSMRAFLYWLDLLRWAAKNSTIGKDSSSSIKSGWGTYLIDNKTDNRVYVGGCGTVINMIPPVTINEWELLQERINNQVQLPMFVKFLHDAQESMRLDYPERAIVELALACENYLRYSVFHLLPESLREDFVVYIEEANINKFLNKFFKNSVAPDSTNNFMKIKKDISSLFDKRNKYMHMGKMDNPTNANYRRYLSAVESLFEIKISDQK